MKRAIRSSVARFAALAVVGFAALAGCSSGEGTKGNPITEGPGAGPSYTGPAPATADIQAFRINFWENVRRNDRCGNCHMVGGQAPQFARSDDVNAAYQQASAVVNRETPSQSIIVTKVGGGHNCWLPDAGACASILTRWIQDWVGASGTAGRRITLIPPTSVRDPGSSKRFPMPAPSDWNGVYQLLNSHCSNCHQSNSATAQSPYFASDDPAEAYLAAIPKINLDEPAQSRFVVRLGRESHNCWTNSCADDAATMLAAIETMANAIDPTQIPAGVVASKALTLYEGTVAAGGNRYESAQIALYEFKTGNGSTAFDTSGVDPAADLQLSGDVTWVGGWGINIRSGKAQAATAASRKLHQLITATGEYSIEGWVIPGNVTQEDARIVSYSGSTTARNFTMGQTMYNYDFLGRSTSTGGNGLPALSTEDDAERLQSALQHVVMTFDPVNGRRIYVNGEFTGDLDAQGGGTLGDWDNSFALVLGNEVSNNRQWMGVIRLVAIHNRALNLQQIQQNFQAGVGEKFFLLFGIEHLINVPRSYIVFEAAEYDSAGYLFTNPKFVSLDPNAHPGNIPLQSMRIGVNGAEPLVGQAYRPLDIVINDANYSPETGQTLSTVGTIIAREQGPMTDEFFLCFDRIGDRTGVCSEYAERVPGPRATMDKPSDIGVRTFDEINATMAAVTGVSPNTAAVKTTFDSVRQSLPAVDSIEAFLASHQTAIAQLAIQYCSALVDSAAAAAYFPGLNLDVLPSVAFPNGDNAAKDRLVDPLITRMIGTNLSTQPLQANLKLDTTGLGGHTRLGLYSLINTLSDCGGTCSAGRTRVIAKATCGAVLGSGAVLIQ
jgi:Concanavalin A-like lectin/glucanases superfamily